MQYSQIVAILWLAFALFAPAAMSGTCEPFYSRPFVSLKKCGNLKVLTLTGGPTERARAYGELLRGPLSPTVINYFSQKVPSSAPVGQGLIALLYNQVVRLLQRATPTYFSEEIDALAAGMGVDPIVVKRGMALPDLGANMNALSGLPLLGSLPASGCTSVARRDESGNFVYGRNLDFAGVGVWDAHPLLTVVIPAADSPELKHIVIGADGALFGGITGVNERGITFAVHQNYSRIPGWNGVPMMLIGEAVLREARSLEEAIEILRRLRPAIMWSFVLTDLKKGEALTVESSPYSFSVRKMAGDSFAQTNHLQTPEAQPFEAISLGTLANSEFRFQFAQSEALKEAPSVALVARILSAQRENSGELSAYQDVLKAHTIQTAIFFARQGEEPELSVAVDPAPTASGHYAIFKLAELYGETIPFNEIDPTLTPPLKRARQREISEAFRAYFDQKNIPAALRILAAHRTLDASLFRAVALRELGHSAEAELEASEALRNPRFLGEPAYIRESLQWIALLSLLDQGKQDEAKNLAAQILATKPSRSRVRRLVEKVSAGLPPPRESLKFEFFTGDIGGRDD